MGTIIKRKTSAGEVRYAAQVRLKGSKLQMATFNRKTDAKRWIQQTEAAIREGRHFRTAEAKRRTVAEMVDRYLEDVLPTKSSEAQRKQAHAARQTVYRSLYESGIVAHHCHDAAVL